MHLPKHTSSSLSFLGQPIGFIGLGSMGMSICKRMLCAGYCVQVCLRSLARITPASFLMFRRVAPKGLRNQSRGNRNTAKDWCHCSRHTGKGGRGRQNACCLRVYICSSRSWCGHRITMRHPIAKSKPSRPCTVLFGDPDSEHNRVGALATLPVDATVVVHTTLLPDQAVALEKRLRKTGVGASPLFQQTIS
eukprot:SAG11_NODE_1529_length_4738_cov_1.628799_1_plen_192_part_00